MKTCPSCHRNYEDESLVFCLDDGTRLVRAGAADANATWNLPAPGPTVASPRPAQPTAQSTIVASPEKFQRTPPPVGPDRGESRRGILPWVFAIVLVLAASGVLIAWLMTRGRGDDVSAGYPSPTPVPSIMRSPTPTGTPEVDRTPTPDERATATPKSPSQATPTPRAKPMFTVLNDMSLNGSRITYYQRTSFALCQADCSGNANCKAATWIRPGTYNPSDPGMCYLMSAVTQRVPAAGHISAVKN
jgi:hypothetical protein